MTWSSGILGLENLLLSRKCDMCILTLCKFSPKAQRLPVSSYEN